jgi:glycosyltransferase involved in cell wall biosynthesis
MRIKPRGKILITLTDQNILNRQGGVYNFYMNLKPLLNENHVYQSLNNDNLLIKNKIYTSFVHFIRVTSKLRKGNFDCLVLNSSLLINAVLRDSFFVIIAKLLRIKVVIFWHGWNFRNEKYLKFPYSLYTGIMLKSDSAIVLYSEIANSLKMLGFKNKIDLLTTSVSKSAFKYRINEIGLSDEFNLIFFSRVETYKGIYELLEAYRILKNKYPKIRLTIVGDGNELTSVSSLIKNKNILDVIITGYIVGDDKYKLLSSADLFILPSYSEGMPGAVLEAMAVGLPIIVTPVGGLNDFFEDGLMGSFISIKDVQSIVDQVEKLYLDVDKRKTISSHNLQYANQHFIDEIVYKNLKNIIDFV